MSSALRSNYRHLRPHRYNIDAAYCNRCHTLHVGTLVTRMCYVKMAEPIEMPFGPDSCGCKEPRIRWGQDRTNLCAAAKVTSPRCGLFQITLDTCYTVLLLSDANTGYVSCETRETRENTFIVSEQFLKGTSESVSAGIISDAFTASMGNHIYKKHRRAESSYNGTLYLFVLSK